MNPKRMTRVIAGKRFSTDNATLLADDVYWDGNNMERNGRNTFLYRTPKGNYFKVVLTQWQGEFDDLIPICLSEAQALYEGPLREHHVSYPLAFPGVDIEDA
jgi:hypothetical protein